jgi:hypothetical protein
MLNQKSATCTELTVTVTGTVSCTVGRVQEALLSLGLNSCTVYSVKKSTSSI